jgi:hypothetical protein
MKKTTAALTVISSFLVLGLFATAHGSGYGSGYRGGYGSGYGYGGGGYERGSRYEYRGNDRYYDDRYRGDRYYDDRYRGTERRPIRPQAPTNAAPAPAPAAQ